MLWMKRRRTVPMDDALAQLISDYADCFSAWSQLTLDSYRKANRLVDKGLKLEADIKAREGGRAAFASLMDHADPGVRLWSAGGSLNYDEAKAVAVLESLRPLQSLVSTDAFMTLKAWREGRMEVR